MKVSQDTIANIATSTATQGAIAIIRISGPEALACVSEIFSPKNKTLDLLKAKGFRIFYGTIKKNTDVIDDVLLSVFRAPNSFTGEDMVEISCHGSEYICNRILEILVENRVRLSTPGEFTMRAFLNGKIDLSQAEAIADLVAAKDASQHTLAMKQMRGGYSAEIKKLREDLVRFTSLIELELDFSEEDVEFADRGELMDLVQEIQRKVNHLCESFHYGNAFKKGIPVAIVGETNVGKSTLLNALLSEEKSIVTSEKGTTRDIIEDCRVIQGVTFRFIDTAGLREASGKVEKIGIQKTYEKLATSAIVLLMVDACEESGTLLNEITNFKKQLQRQHLIIVLNKTDKVDQDSINKIKNTLENLAESYCFISAKYQTNLDELISQITEKSKVDTLSSNELIVSNIRHYKALKKGNEAIANALQGLKNKLPTDLITQDIREALHFLGEITGEITSEEILHSIFSTFCIGK